MALTVSISEIVDSSKNRLLAKHDSWGRVRLGDIATVQNGFAFKSDQFTKDGGMPLIRIRDVGKDTAETNYKGNYEPEYIVESGDLLIGMDGNFNCARWRGPRGLLNQRVCRVKIVSDVYHPKLLDYALPGYLRAINDVTSSVTVKHLSSRTVADIPLPLPPMDQQLRIVSEIEKQFSRLDEAVANLKRVKANLKRYKAAVLKAAVEGKLTEEWRKAHPDVEPASELLKRILAERRAKWKGKGKYKEPNGPNTLDLPPLPENWTWASLDQLLCSLCNGISTKPDAESGLRILRISALRPLSLHVEDVRFLSGSNEDFADYILNPGDLLFTRYNGNPSLVGVCGVVPHIKETIVHPDKLIRGVLASSLCLPMFVAIMVNVGVARDYLARRVRTTAGQAGISGGDLRTTPLPLAPIAEQERIVAESERRLSFIGELKTTVSADLQRAKRLREAVLAMAFSGGLNSEAKAEAKAIVVREETRNESA
jgi:type I restriction enzyme S subunit